MKKLYSIKRIPKLNATSFVRHNVKWRRIEGHKQSTQPYYYYGELSEVLGKYFGKVHAELVISPRLAQRYAKENGKKIQPVTEGDYSDGFYVY